MSYFFRIFKKLLTVYVFIYLGFTVYNESYQKYSNVSKGADYSPRTLVFYTLYLCSLLMDFFNVRLLILINSGNWNMSKFHGLFSSLSFFFRFRKYDFFVWHNMLVEHHIVSYNIFWWFNVLWIWLNLVWFNIISFDLKWFSLIRFDLNLILFVDLIWFDMDKSSIYFSIKNFCHFFL